MPTRTTKYTQKITSCNFFFFSSRRRHTRCGRDWSSDVCSSDLPQALAVAPGRELHPRRLTDAHEVIPLPADQRDLCSRRRHAAQARRAGDGLNSFQPIIEWGEIPAAATWADDPQPALPLVKRDPTAHTETGWTAVAVERRVAESTGTKHDATLLKTVRK